MGPSDSAEAVEALDLLLKFLGDGERWVKGRWSDRRGNRCLVGASILSAAITRSTARGLSAIWRTKFPPRRSATAMSGAAPASGRVFAVPSREMGIRPARLSCGGTAFPISTMGVAILPSCGGSFCRRARGRCVKWTARRRCARTSTWRWTNVSRHKSGVTAPTKVGTRSVSAGTGFYQRT